MTSAKCGVGDVCSCKCNKRVATKKVTMDGNEAAAYVSYRMNEACIIFPITPSSSMGELADEYASRGYLNVFGTIPTVVEMQSEAGAAGAMHGALQGGTLTTTFTSSQGLLLMYPNMFKISAELLPNVIVVAARTVGKLGLSIYGDHTDVMAVRGGTGYTMICASNAQEAHDLCVVSNLLSVASEVPVLIFFDGFRTSHEIMNVNILDNDELGSLVDFEQIRKHRERKLTPENPCARGVIYNPDVCFQSVEASNRYYNAVPRTFNEISKKFSRISGRSCASVEYFGASDAERIVVLMGSGVETAIETVEHLNKVKKEKVGVIKVRLFYPFPKEEFMKIIPASCKAIAILDRTKEPCAAGEPLYEEIATTLLEYKFSEGERSKININKFIGGRYGLASKEFTPAMVKAVLDELKKDKPKNHFTVGINDDLTGTSLEYDNKFHISQDGVVNAIFYGLGSDGTVGANKNTIKIIGEETNLHVQAYFVFDAKKSGAVTVSHLRFGPEEIRSTYLIGLDSANFIGCHQFEFVKRINILKDAAPGSIFLLNSSFGADEVWDYLPIEMQQSMIEKKIKFYVVDAYKVAKESGMGNRMNTIMQTCFFALSGVLPKEEAIAKIKESVKKTYAKKGSEIINKNFAAIDNALADLHEVKYESKGSSSFSIRGSLANANESKFIRNVIAKMIDGRGDEIPTSEFSIDGSFPTNTTKLEKRNIATQIPKWIPEACIQCGRCSLVCPHGAIRAKRYDSALLEDKAHMPGDFQSAKIKAKGFPDQSFTLQVYAEDCTGCGLCVETCPVNKGTDKKRAVNLIDKPNSLEKEIENVKFFENIKQYETISSDNVVNSYGGCCQASMCGGCESKCGVGSVNSGFVVDAHQNENVTVRDVQYMTPMFEFSGACAGCGESPYVKLLTQLYGNRLMIANAAGCSSVYSSQLPTSPWTMDENGKGPAWASSLFEDNAEFGLGFRIAHDKQTQFARELLLKLGKEIGEGLVQEILNARQSTKQEIEEQRNRIVKLKNILKNLKSFDAAQLIGVTDYLIRHSIWAIGGDGWAYDIGFGGVDHVLASGRKINILVMDTEVYSNTGGQASKATPRGAVAKFAASGKRTAKKDLGLQMMMYGNIYVASVALGADQNQAVKAFVEADAYPGSSILICYSHCIAHGIDMQKGLNQQKLAVDCGYWPLYRYNPSRVKEGLNPFQLDSKPSGNVSFKDYAYNENRYKILLRANEKEAEMLAKMAEEDIARRWKQYKALASIDFSNSDSDESVEKK